MSSHFPQAGLMEQPEPPGKLTDVLARYTISLVYQLRSWINSIYLSKSVYYLMFSSHESFYILSIEEHC
jgi:hypothetical protein